MNLEENQSQLQEDLRACPLKECASKPFLGKNTYVFILLVAF